MKQKPQLSEEEIIRDWSLNSVDISFIRRFKTPYHICALKFIWSVTG